MKVENSEELIAFSSDGQQAKARRLLIELYQAAVNSVNPRAIIQNKIKYDSKKQMLSVEGDQYPVKSRKIWIVGAGKAVGGMAEALEGILDGTDYEGMVCVPRGVCRKLSLKSIICLPSSHPFPSEKNLQNTNLLLKFIDRANTEDLIIFLLSGGGSAIFIAPIFPITLEDIIILNKALIESGMSIHEVNKIRKHVSEVKGGKLAEKISCETLTLILSDVIGDNLESIASGPLVPDSSTFSDSKSLLMKYDLWEKRIPGSVKRIIQKGIDREIPETLKKNSLSFDHIRSYIIASNRIACKKAISHAEKKGLRSIFLTDKIEGDARWLGKILARVYSGLSEAINEPLLIVSGGESTVKVQGDGIGGRNQELAASLLKELSSTSINIAFAFISAGTDGIDGNSKFAGVIIDNQTISTFGQKKVNLKDYQLKSDICNFFKEIGGSLLLTGPTGTNVMDIQILIANSDQL